MGSKIFLETDVYEAANQRLEVVFNDFDKVCVAFSGGKDSGVLLNLCLDFMRKHGIRRKLGVLIVDLEGQYDLTIQYITRMLDDNIDIIEPFWVCLPLNLRNSVSVYEPFWCCWEPGMEDRRIRPLPDHNGVISDQDYFPFFRYRMEFEEFVPEFASWYASGSRLASLIGIRTDESLNRFRTIASRSKTRHRDFPWTTRVADQVYNCYPIYDWGTEDIWTANGRFDWDYNKLYDMFYKAGVGIHDMRICQPYGDDQRIGLELFRVIEPHTWAKVVNRVSGANFGNVYCGTKMLGYRKVELPPGHTWKSYTRLLLRSLPPETRANYIDKFVKFIRYWHRKGSAVAEDQLALLPDEAEITDQFSIRGAQNKRLVKYRRIPDALDSKLESKRAAPTWRRMAACILKNDYLCKGLSFSQTKDQLERIRELKEKYRNI